MKGDFSLPEDIKQQVVEYWNSAVRENDYSKLDLPKIVGHVYPGKKGTSREGRAIKLFLSSKNLKYTPQLPKSRADKVDLTDEQKTFISENLHLSSPMELAQALFPQKKLNPNSLELKAVKEYIESLPEEILKEANYKKEEIRSGKPSERCEYSPPKSMGGLIPVVNKYCKTNYLKESDLKEVERKSLHVLLGHLNGYSFLNKIRSYKKKEDQELFESCFIRYCYDKYDVTQEQVDLYLLLCNENVNQNNLKIYEDKLREALQDKLDADDSKNVKAITDAINNAQSKLNESTKQIQTITKYLENEKEKRIKERGAGSADMTKIIEAFQFEKSRQQLLMVAEKERVDEEEEELERIKTLEDTIMLIAGATEEELLYG